VRVCVCIYVYTIYIYTHTHHMHVHIYIMYAYMHTCILLHHLQQRVRVCIYTYTHTYHMHVYMYVCMHTCILLHRHIWQGSRALSAAGLMNYACWLMHALVGDQCTRSRASANSLASSDLVRYLRNRSVSLLGAARPRTPLPLQIFD